MKTVYKYVLDLADQTIVRLPINYIVRHVGTQKVDVSTLGHRIKQERVCLWVEVDPDEELTTEVPFRIVGTGHPIPAERSFRYLGTTMMNDGQLVWHVYGPQPLRLS